MYRVFLSGIFGTTRNILHELCSTISSMIIKFNPPLLMRLIIDPMDLCVSVSFISFLQLFLFPYRMGMILRILSRALLI